MSYRSGENIHCLFCGLRLENSTLFAERKRVRRKANFHHEGHEDHEGIYDIFSFVYFVVGKNCLLVILYDLIKENEPSAFAEYLCSFSPLFGRYNLEDFKETSIRNCPTKPTSFRVSFAIRNDSSWSPTRSFHFNTEQTSFNLRLS
jgi:hypothetical protein